MVAELQPLIDRVWGHCERTGNRGRTVTPKIKFADFEIVSRSGTLASTVTSRATLAARSIGLLEAAMPLPKPVRILGISLSSLQNEGKIEPQFGLPL